MISLVHVDNHFGQNVGNNLMGSYRTKQKTHAHTVVAAIVVVEVDSFDVVGYNYIVDN